MQAPAVGSWLGTDVRNLAKRAAAMGWQSTWGQTWKSRMINTSYSYIVIDRLNHSKLIHGSLLI